MAISHACLNCGTDLARVRAVREPHYGLPLVVCPGCGSAAVRNRHVIHQRWRGLLRVSKSLIAAVAQLIALVLCAGGVITLCILIQEETRWFLGGASTEPIAACLPAVMVIAVAVLSGVWLTAGLAHWKRAWAWAIFTILIAISLSIDTVIAPAVTQLTAGPGGFGEKLDYEMPEWLFRLLVLGVMMMIATAGIPPGILARRWAAALRQSRWRARRKRLRARRHA
jgi:hypothetical protein